MSGTSGFVSLGGHHCTRKAATSISAPPCEPHACSQDWRLTRLRHHLVRHLPIQIAEYSRVCSYNCECISSHNPFITSLLSFQHSHPLSLLITALSLNTTLPSISHNLFIITTVTVNSNFIYFKNILTLLLQTIKAQRYLKKHCGVLV